jgi:hypothetical protein
MINIQSIIADCATLADAKAIARDMRKTAAVVSEKYGIGHPTTVAFDKRYWDFVDEMALHFAKGA